MMENKINCYIDMFSGNQTVCYNDGSKESVPTDGLASYLVTLCYSENVNKIHFFGNENYINGIIVTDIRTAESVKYGKSNIEIEVN